MAAATVAAAAATAATAATAALSPLSLLQCTRALRTVTRVSLRRTATSFARSPRSPWTKRCVRQINSSATNEEAAAKVAATNNDIGGPTIFDKIISKEIPSTIVYEDDKVLAFRDISPQAPVHVLLIPKLRDGLSELGKAEARHAEVLGHLLYAAKLVAEKEGIQDGFRVVINSGAEACQSVYHLHLHILGGRQMKWPPG